MLYDKVVIPLKVALPVELSSSIEYSHYSNHQSSSIFEWSATDNPSEMNYDTATCNICLCALCYPCLWPLVPMMIYKERNFLKSQKIKITDTHFDFEHDTWGCCCFTYPPITYNISLDKVLFITTSKMGGYNNFFLTYRHPLRSFALVGPLIPQ